MKNPLSKFAFAALLCILFSATGCRTSLTGIITNLQKYQEQAEAYMKKNCPYTEIENPITGNLDVHYQCDSIWNTDAITAKCDNIKFCVDVTKASLSLDVSCKNLIPIPAIDSLLGR